MNELVSIIMPSYNTARFIKETVDSVFAQTYKNFELIIVDDCSTDDTDDVVAPYLSDARVKYIKNEKNSGAAVSRNRALQEAAGKWIAFLDSDDLWHPEKLEKQLKFMSEKQCAFSFTHYYFDRGAEGIREFSPEKDEYTYKDILKHCYIACPTVIYDVTALGKVYMPTDAIKREDFGCWLSILRRGVNAHCLHESLLTVKIHEGSVSYNKTKMIKYQWNVYRKVEKISFFATCYYMMHWAIKGFLKYR